MHHLSQPLVLFSLEIKGLAFVILQLLNDKAVKHFTEFLLGAWIW